MGDGIQKKHAIIINGDTETRHLDNVEIAIAALRDEDSDYDIYVASTVAPKQEVNAFETSDPSGLQKLIDGLSSQIDDDDLLLIYTTGHGYKKGQDICFQLSTTWRDHSCFKFENLQQSLDKIKYGKRIVVMDQCYSGSGFSFFANPKSVVLTQGAANESVSCSLFSPYFWSKQVPDQNDDGIISLQERYAYALLAGRTTSLTQYFNPGLEIALSGEETEKAPFTNEVQHISIKQAGDDAKLQEALDQLQPGQLALVTFSASPWCPACENYRPVFEQLAQQYQGKFLMLRVEAESGNPQQDATWAKEKYGITAFPTVAFMGNKDGDGLRKINRVDDLMDPAASLLKASFQDPDSVIQHYKLRLASSNVETRLQAIKDIATLGQAGADFIPQLLQALEDPENRPIPIKTIGPIIFTSSPQNEVFPAIINTVIAIGPAAATAAIPALHKLLSSTTYEDNGNKALLTLAKLGDKSVIPQLIEALYPTDSGYSALRSALAEFGEDSWPFAMAISKKLDPKDYKSFADFDFILFAKNWGNHAAELFEMFESPELEAKFFAAYILEHFPEYEDKLYPQLISFSTSINPLLKELGIKVLSSMLGRNPKLMDKILKNLQSKDSQCRLDATVLLQNLSWDKSSYRDEAARALSPLLTDPHPYCRVQALASLQKLATLDNKAAKEALETARPQILDLVKSNDESSRVAGIKAFSVIASKQDFTNYLFPLLGVPTPEVHDEIIAALRERKDLGSQEILQELLNAFNDAQLPYGLRTTALKALCLIAKNSDPKLGEAIIDQLVPLLLDAPPEIRSKVAEALGELQQIPSRSLFIASLLIATLRDQDSNVRMSAFHALASMLFHRNQLFSKEEKAALIEELHTRTKAASRKLPLDAPIPENHPLKLMNEIYRALVLE